MPWVVHVLFLVFLGEYDHVDIACIQVLLDVLRGFSVWIVVCSSSFKVLRQCK